MDDDLSVVENQLPGLMGGINESAGTPAPAPNLDFSSLYGDAPYEGREESPVSTPPTTPPAAPAANDEELRALRARNDQLETYVRGIGEQAEATRREQVRYQEEAGAYNAAAQRAAAFMDIPEVNPDEILGDPKKFKGVLQGVAQRAAQATLAYLEPANRELQALRAERSVNLQRGQESAMAAAAARVKELGYAEEEFGDAERRAVTQRLRSLGPDGELMLADPRQVVSAFVLGRAESGNLLPRKAPAAPANTPTNSSRRAANGKVPMQRLPPAAQAVLGRLQIPMTGDLTPDEVAMLRAGGIG